MALIDIGVMEFSIFGGFLVRLALNPWLPIELRPDTYVGLTIAVLFVPVVYGLIGLYPGYGLNSIERFRKRVLVTFSLFVGMVAWDAIFQSGQWSRGLLIITFFFAIFISPGVESLFISLVTKLKKWGTPVILVGANYSAENLIRAMNADPKLGYVPIAYFDDEETHWGQNWEGVPVIGAIKNAKEWQDKTEVAVISLHEEASFYLTAIMSELPFRRVIVAPDLGVFQTLWVTARDIGGNVGLEVKKNLLVRRNQIVKRIIDLVIGSIAFLIALPIIILFAIIIKAVSPGPAFYFQKRDGLNGSKIKVWKLRSMLPDAEALLEKHLAENPAAKKEWETYVKLTNDPRIIPTVGNFIRRWSIDELPQLWGVIDGSMSLVGPRPFPDYHLELFDPIFREFRSSVRPGITGLWQVSIRSGGDLEVQERLDSYYIQNWSLWIDIYILFRTLTAVIKAEGAV